MRFRFLPSARLPSAQRFGLVYDHLVFNRILLLTSHILLGLAAVLAYSSTFDNSRLRWWSRVGMYLVVKAAPAWIPYAISAAHSYHRATARWLDAWLFVAVLTAGTAAVGYIYLTPTAYQPRAFWIAGTAVIQTAVYLLAATALLRREPEE